ncbi:1-Cys peroxiredoxin [Capsicum annuum]|uniref:Peroxiredoxin n=1 Tax=Capsicum annuum TaxID=4072 RepID=A0A2G2YHJ2_CAPAN|nr:1-Cys peroxiredoxin [Capsicum annuum]
MPGLTIGDDLPNLEVETTNGKMKLHDYVGDSYTILFSHPGDFTPVCTTELGMMAAYANKFAERGVKLLGLSCDDVHSHKEWIKDIEAYNKGHKVTYPIIADSKRELIKQLNMVDPEETDSSGHKLPSRALHIVGPDKKKAAKHKIATPANWKPGEPVVISPNVSTEQAKEMFPQGFDTANLPSGKSYLRFTNV